MQQSIGAWQVRRRKASEQDDAFVDNYALLEVNKRIGSAGLVENTSPWATTIGRLTGVNSRPTNIIAGGGNVS